MNDSITSTLKAQQNSPIKIDYITASVGDYSFTFVYGMGLQKDYQFRMELALYLSAKRVAESSIDIANAYIRYINNELTKDDMSLLTDYMHAVIAQENQVPPPLYVKFANVKGAFTRLHQYAINHVPKSQEVLPKLNPSYTQPKVLKRRGKSGYVYLLPSPVGLYKIGLTTDPAKRRKTFDNIMPFDVQFIAIIKTSDSKSLERQLHTRFKDKRVKCEWFRLDEADVAYIVGLVEKELAA